MARVGVGHLASEADGHDLHCFQALRRMDEILVANFMVFQEVVESGLYDLVVGDEAWDVDHFWHENPELKRGAHVWFTDFVGFLPMPDGGEREAALTADYNAEMVEHIARFPGSATGRSSSATPRPRPRRRWAPASRRSPTGPESHFDFCGYVTGDTPPTDESAPSGGRLGYREDEQVCVVTVGGSGVGRALLDLAVAACPHVARVGCPGFRMIAVAGPRIDPAASHAPWPGGARVSCRTSTATSRCATWPSCRWARDHHGARAAQRPFLYFPLLHHF